MRWSFLDRIDSLQSGTRAVGRKGVASSEDYFADHFPGYPIVPGVILVEAMAQLSGKLIEISVYDQVGRWVWPILSITRKAKFRRFVRPGDTVVLESELRELRGESAICRVVAKVDGKRVADGELMFVFNPGDLDSEAAQHTLETLERKNLDQLWSGYREWAAQERPTPEGENG